METTIVQWGIYFIYIYLRFRGSGVLGFRHLVQLFRLTPFRVHGLRFGYSGGSAFGLQRNAGLGAFSWGIQHNQARLPLTSALGFACCMLACLRRYS